MKPFVLNTSKYEVVDQEGTVLLSAPLTELYYTIALATESSSQDKKQSFIQAANAVNAEYNTSFDWGQIIEIFNDLSEQMEDLKKNTTSTQE